MTENEEVPDSELYSLTFYRRDTSMAVSVTLDSPAFDNQVLDYLHKAMSASVANIESNSYIDIVFDGPPENEAGRFVEAEDSEGHGINAGTWIEREDGYWVLRIPRLGTQS